MTHAPRSAPTVLYALTAKEWGDFFPGGMREEALGLGAGRVECWNPLEVGAAEWEEGLRRLAPEVVVTGWKTRALPDGCGVGCGGPVRYVCHLPGSVRKLVSSEAIRGGLLVTNWGNSISRVVAECGLLLTLAALRRLSHWSLAMHREGAWKNEQTVFHSLFERRVGLHGFGVIAQELNRLLRPFGVPVSAYSPSVPDELLRAHGVRRAGSLAELFGESEVVVELAAYTPQNYHIVTEDLLRRIPEGGVFVNIGRGAVVDEEALVRVAREGRLQVALDVYEQEPLPTDHPLRGLPNVTLLPHLGGPTLDRRRDSGRLALENLRRYFVGEPLQALITPEIYARST